MSTPPAMPSIESLTAPLMLVELANMFLFGVLTVQVYLYHITFPRDASYIKYLVYGVYLLDLASTAMTIADTYHWFVSGFGSVAALNDVFLSPIDTPFMGALLAAITQSFYCYRIWKINSKALPISIFVGLIALAQVIAGLYGAIVGHIAGTFSEAADKTLVAIYIVFIGAAAADVFILLTMLVLLLFNRKQEHQHSNFILTKILILVVETNMLSSTLAVLVIILLVGLPNNNYFTCPSLFLGKIYSNSLLLMLNNRHYLSTGPLQVPSTTDSSGNTLKSSSNYHLSTFRSEPNPPTVSQSMSQSMSTNQGVSIDVGHEISRHSDAEGKRTQYTYQNEV